jgi:hypothetical protein
MQNTIIKEIKKLGPGLVGIVATFLSLGVFIFQFMGFEYSKVALGLLGALVGAMLSYVISRVQSAMTAPKVFISYTQRDKDFAHKLAATLERHTSANVLIDTHELRVGDNINERIGELVNNADYFVFVISKVAIQSKWANSELESAIEMKKKILPVLLEKVDTPDVLKGIVYADFSDSFDKGIEQLILTLKERKHNKRVHTDAG